MTHNRNLFIIMKTCSKRVINNYFLLSISQVNRDDDLKLFINDFKRIEI